MKCELGAGVLSGVTDRKAGVGRGAAVGTSTVMILSLRENWTGLIRSYYWIAGQLAKSSCATRYAGGGCPSAGARVKPNRRAGGVYGGQCTENASGQGGWGAQQSPRGRVRED